MGSRADSISMPSQRMQAMPARLPVRSPEIQVTTVTDGDETIKTTVTTIYHEDGRVQTKTSKETTTSRRVKNTDRHRVSARTQNRTTNKDGRRVKITTVTTTFSDGTEEDEVSETDLGPAEFETTTKTVQHESPRSETTRTVVHETSRRSSTSSSSSAMSASFAPPIQNVMNEDIDRLNAENDLKRAIRGDDYDTIYDCITTCKRWKSHPDTNDLINDGWERLKEIRPNDAKKIVDEQYADLPYMGMKKYLRNNGVARNEVDTVPGPHYKYELSKLANANGIRFPADRKQLEGLMRIRSQGGYNSNR